MDRLSHELEDPDRELFGTFGHEASAVLFLESVILELLVGHPNGLTTEPVTE